ncbi:MAG TPA: DUF4112 domain-containing protein [Pyrinomonadaceae bacterium]|jgi:hypothetical protein|nr:DUF4112 domain-containing protein [Pyrinomonadaceae bacterium]
MRELELNEGGVGRVAAAKAVRQKSSPAEVEQSLDQLSRWMDGLFRVPGTGWRFGLDAIVGLIPGVGDTLTTVVSFYILAAGVRYRVPKVTLLRMGANLAVDYVVGAIPLVGDLFDVAWKSNQMNVELLRRRATVSPAEAKRGRLSDWLFVGLIMLCLAAMLVGSVVVAWYILSFLGGKLSTLF